MKTTRLGSISSGTLRTQDLLMAFLHELQAQVLVNGEYYSKPENFKERDRLARIEGEAMDCFDDDGQIREDKEEEASMLVNEDLMDALNNFAPAYAHFGAHEGDGADFGYWPDCITDIQEQVEFSSRKEQEYPDEDYRGEWLHINELGNCTLYVREESGKDREIWGIV